jgi:membrane-bound serine protease (ClpP class)
MFKFLKYLILFCSVTISTICSSKELENNSSTSNVNSLSNIPTAYQIPIRDQIGPPILDILRRGLKNAIEVDAEMVILDMNTPGGELGVTLEIMQEIIDVFDKFEGPIITYVNKEAISAGAYIAMATNEIAFAPYASIGAAEAVSGGGANIDSSMKRKINSYLKAKIRSYTKDYRYRSRVMSAMMDANETLLIEGKPILAADGTVIQKKGELLTLTAEEAVNEYGSPPQPLLGIGIYKSVEELLDKKYGAKNYKLIKMNINWAENIGLWLNSVGPIIIGIGLLGLFIEFKTPGFGIFGIGGIVFVLIFFGSKYVAGLAGYEEIIIFLMGVSFIAIELFLLPGLIFPGVVGFVMILGSILWAMVDIWPNTEFSWNIEIFKDPIKQLGLSLLVSVGLVLLLTRILPQTTIWNGLILSKTVGNINSVENELGKTKPKPGSEGKSISELYPIGQVEINGVRYEARSNLGKIKKGATVRVSQVENYEIIVDKI